MRHGRRRITWQGSALVVGGVVAGCALVTAVPQETVVETPFVVEGAVGETLDLTYADLTVTDVRVADTVESFSETAVANGTFVVVDATWRATQGATVFRGAEITDAEGRRFWPTDQAECSISANAQPGYAWRITYCFDVPQDALAGATVRLARGDQTEDYAEQRRDAAAMVDLGISAQQAKELWAATDTVQTEAPGYATASAGGSAG
ncbi:hypothetical protein [Promicromonospora sp. NPDC090134]|uniref:hypothetical protein n=1 Tax=Promicromonospora sp. NPDC090134 TaxID=3364408 RepID=UPI00381775E7